MGLRQVEAGAQEKEWRGTEKKEGLGAASSGEAQQRDQRQERGEVGNAGRPRNRTPVGRLRAAGA